MEDSAWDNSIGPSIGEGCVFCAQVESVAHLFVECTRSVGLFRVLGLRFLRLGECFFMHYLFLAQIIL